MAILKCKMCGGDLQIEEVMTVCECEYCGSKQTVPTIDNEKKTNLYERANRLRYNCEFDKAETVYESIVGEFHEEAEAYWGLVLCKYGIEYVDDPATGNKVPTCHRSSFDSVMDDSDFEMVMENADAISRQVYREQAKQIEEIRKGIIEVSGKEEPYDIFICYKETAEDGQRTIDSVLAQDVYEALTDKGYRVFFSRITLEDKIGTEYEPYIFAALNSAKIMLAFGTTYDNYNAVWVKNEWSRFLKLMSVDKNKYLIPCYKNIDAYDIPKEFAKFQAQDMGKLGAIQDLIRGIDKLIGKSNTINTIIVEKTVSNYEAYLKKGYLALEDNDWDEARRCFNDVININPELAEAYLGLVLLEQECDSIEEFVCKTIEKTENIAGETINLPYVNQDEIDELVKNNIIHNYLFKREIIEKFECDCEVTLFKAERLAQFELEKDFIQNDKIFRKAIRFAEGNLKSKLEQACRQILDVMEKRVYEADEHDRQEQEKVKSRQIETFNNAKLEIQTLYNNALRRKADDYNEACEKFKNEINVDSLLQLCDLFADFGEYKDSANLSDECADKAKNIIIQKRNRKKRILTSIITVVVIISAIVIVVIASWKDIKKVYAKKLMEDGRYEEAYNILNSGNYDDAETIIKNNELKRAQKFLELGDYENGYEILNILGDFGDAKKILQDSMCLRAENLYEKQLYDEALELLNNNTIAGLDSSVKLKIKIKYMQACILYENKEFEDALVLFGTVPNYEDASEKINEIQEILAIKSMELGDFESAYYYFYKNKDDRRLEVAYKEAERLFKDQDYENAYAYYKKAVDYEDADEKSKETAYMIACSLYDAVSYKKAADWFFKCGEAYKDADSKADEAKYQYVLGHKSLNDSITTQYIIQLKNKKYKDSLKIYNELNTYGVTVCVNGSNFSTRNEASVSTKSNIWFHATLNGGIDKSDGSILKGVVKWPDGTTDTEISKSKIKPGDTFHFGWFFNESENVKTGTGKVTVYDENGKELGSQTFTLKK